MIFQARKLFLDEIIQQSLSQLRLKQRFKIFNNLQGF